MTTRHFFPGWTDYVCNACDHEGTGFRFYTDPTDDDATNCEWLECPECGHGNAID